MKKQNRLSNLKHKLSSQKLDALIITHLENIRYLTGFTGSDGMLLVTSRRVALFTDFRYAIQAQEEVSGARIRLGKKPIEQFEHFLEEVKLCRLGFEAEHLSFENYDKIDHICQQHGLELVPCYRLATDLRLIKQPEEIAQIKRAIAIAEAAFGRIIERLKPGIREIDLALELEFEAKRAGSAKLPFEIIVAAAERSAMPHGTATDKVIPSNELVIIDFGASYQGYNADITRTLLLGEPSPKQLELYQLVAKAQAEAIAGVRPGVTASELDKIAREVIENDGYGEYFGHGTGHGVGLEVHEEPNISQAGQIQLAPGMVFTVEPGIYLPEIGGVRIEDMVLVTEDGCEVLTSLPRELVKR